MDALDSAFLDDSSLAGGGKDGKGDVIIEQEEKEVDKDGNTVFKRRTLRNPTKEELEKKTLQELENDEGPDVTTIRSFKIKLKENDMSDHSFSNFNLDNPKPVDPPQSEEDKNRGSLFKSFIWFSIKMAAVVGIGCILFSVYRAYVKNSQASKRRYNSNRNEYSMTNSDDDEEELKNVKNAIRKGGVTNGSNFNSHDD